MESNPQPGTRFPWGYFVATLLPAGLIGAIFILPSGEGHGDAMATAMTCSLLIGPVGIAVIGWGLVRLSCGDGEQFPALRWLVWLPATVGLAGFVLG